MLSELSHLTCGISIGLRVVLYTSLHYVKPSLTPAHSTKQVVALVQLKSQKTGS